MKKIGAAILVVLGVLVIAPLRLTREVGYAAIEHRAALGRVQVVFDSTENTDVSWPWVVRAGPPYRVRVTLVPEQPVDEFLVRGVKIVTAEGTITLPAKTGTIVDSSPLLSAGYRYVPIAGESVRCRIEYSVRGQNYTFEAATARHERVRLVHLGWESITNM